MPMFADAHILSLGYLWCHAAYKAFYKKVPPAEMHQVKVIDLCWTFYCSIESPAVMGIVFHCKHNLIHSYIQSLNPILKVLKFKCLQIRHKACLSPFLVTNWPQRHNLVHENPLTQRPMIAHHARDFTWNRGCSSNFPPLIHGDQIPYPLEDSNNQIPSSPGRQRCSMPGVCPGGMLNDEPQAVKFLSRNLIS